MGKVELGSTVVLQTYDERSRRQRSALRPIASEPTTKQLTFRILGPFEADPSKGNISDQSPLGKALIGHKAGDEISLKVGTDERKYRILEVQ